MSLFNKRASIALIQKIDNEDCVLIGTKRFNNDWELPTTDKQYGETFLAAGLRALHYQAGIQDVQFAQILVHTHRYDTFLTKHHTLFINVHKGDYTLDQNLVSKDRISKWESIHDVVTGNVSEGSKRALMYFLRVLKRKVC